MAPITLTVVSGPAAGSSVTREANTKRIYLGRIKTGNAIPLNDPSVSSKHLEVLFRDGSWFVEDLDSTNGTKLNDGEEKLLTGVQRLGCEGQSQHSTSLVMHLPQQTSLPNWCQQCFHYV
jgi:predicted component of type VI protein secretion system